MLVQFLCLRSSTVSGRKVYGIQDSCRRDNDEYNKTILEASSITGNKTLVVKGIFESHLLIFWLTLIQIHCLTCCCIHHLTCKAEFQVDIAWIKVSRWRVVERCHAAEPIKQSIKGEMIPYSFLGFRGMYWKLLNRWEKTWIELSSWSNCWHFFLSLLFWWGIVTFGQGEHCICGASVFLNFLFLKACVPLFWLGWDVQVISIPHCFGSWERGWWINNSVLQ